MKTNMTTARGFRTAVPAQVVPTEVPQFRLSIVVPYTTPELTKTALEHAATLSAGLAANVRLIDAHVVPMQCALGEPPVNRAFQEARIQGIVEAARIPVNAEIVYTRDRLECFRRTVEPGTLIVIAAGIPWWPTAEKKLARLLMNAGYDVVLVPRTPVRAVR